MIDYLDFLQKLNNALYRILGDHTIVINIQVYINKQRNELDLHDTANMIGEYVQ